MYASLRISTYIFPQSLLTVAALSPRIKQDLYKTSLARSESSCVSRHVWFFTGHYLTRGSGQESVEISRVGSDQEVFNLSCIGSGHSYPTRPDPRSSTRPVNSLRLYNPTYCSTKYDLSPVLRRSRGRRNSLEQRRQLKRCLRQQDQN